MEPEAFATDLARWGADFDDGAEKTEPSSTGVRPRFPWRPELNARLAVYGGDYARVDADALVVPTSERLDGLGGAHERLRRLGGAGYAAALAALGHCRMSEVRVSLAYGVCARHVVHTVGPRYNTKYTTAAVNALNKCYLNALQACVDAGYRTAVFLPLHTDDKNYPVRAGAAVACRTLRRFLEHHPDKLDCIVLCAADPAYAAAYAAELPLYMPRSAREAAAAEAALPADVGNEWGEDAVQERSIRISALPGVDDFDDYEDEEEEAEAEAEQGGNSGSNKGNESGNKAGTIVIGNKTPLALSQKQASPDARVLAAASDPTSPDYVPPAFVQLLDQAAAADLGALARARFAYVGGRDARGGAIVVFHAQAAAAPAVARAQVLPFLARLLDPVARAPYTLVYLHSPLANSADALAWLHDVAAVFPRRCLLHMRLAVVYSTFWLRMHLRINRLADLWDIQDISYYDNLAALFAAVPGADSIAVPPEIARSDPSIVPNDPDAAVSGAVPVPVSQQSSDGL